MKTLPSRPLISVIPLALLTLLIVCDSSCGPAQPAKSPAPAAALVVRNVVRKDGRAEEREQYLRDAEFLTARYALKLPQWNVSAHAAGPRCDVLVLDAGVIMEDSMIEAMHFGTGPYQEVTGSLQRFYHQQGFRGVAYRDKSEKIWTYGNVTEQEAPALVPCRDEAVR
jgi:hypothetical protein